MALVAINWYVFRLIGIPFHLVSGMALVWISNPFTIIPMYFGFYSCGVFMMDLAGYQVDFISYLEFTKAFSNTEDMNIWESLSYWLSYIIHNVFWPMLLGSFFIAVPAAWLGASFIMQSVERYRAIKTKKKI